MSVHWITLIPEDPRFVPDEAKRERARERFAEIAPEAREITADVTDTIQFFHCGENFNGISCPACASDIPLRWWHDCIHEDYSKEAGYKLAMYSTPCCGFGCTMHDLAYDFPQGLGRFSLSAMNPYLLGSLDERYRAEFEAILGTKLRVIYVHL
ncbi:MAG: hypothetical protein KF902_00335 [Phycisphaeraceae bacterium]|nr:hypothetical protein [Phycisphaeraceae bacterium]MCW5769636.1 hypothetical protein [Phycisphaeraceae bacterium]